MTDGEKLITLLRELREEIDKMKELRDELIEEHGMEEQE